MRNAGIEQNPDHCPLTQATPSLGRVRQSRSPCPPDLVRRTMAARIPTGFSLGPNGADR
jgi:hypothetical protein